MTLLGKITLKVKPLLEVNQIDYDQLYDLTNDIYSTLINILEDPEEDDIALLVYNNNKLIGWGCLSPMEDCDSAQFGIFVNPQYRNLGIGRKIFKRAVKEAKKQEYVGLYAQAADGHGSEFWEQLGFEINDRESPIGHDYIL